MWKQPGDDRAVLKQRCLFNNVTYIKLLDKRKMNIMLRKLWTYLKRPVMETVAELRRCSRTVLLEYDWMSYITVFLRWLSCGHEKKGTLYLNYILSLIWLRWSTCYPYSVNTADVSSLSVFLDSSETDVWLDDRSYSWGPVNKICLQNLGCSEWKWIGEGR
jgi:hypothetical protein